MRVARIPSVLVVAALAVVAVAADDGAESPRAGTWDDMVRDVFDVRWLAPETRTDPSKDADRQPVDLARRMRALAAMRFPIPDGAGVAADVAADLRPETFGDLLVRCRGFGVSKDGAKSRDAWLETLKEQRRDIWEQCGDDLLQLGRDEFLAGAKWDPAKDHDRDGILHAAPFPADCEGTEPWTKIDASRLFQQGATVFFADLEAIKTAENDYTKYPSNVGADYDYIRAVPGSFVAGKDSAGRPFNALRIEFRADLPFPYTHYDCDLRILNRVGADGLVRSDIWSPSKDFYWMAGQDVFVPFATHDGAFAGLGLARVYGFDMDSVPDGESNIREALRGSLGNLKRNAQKLFAEYGGAPRTLRDTLPEFIVRGVKTEK